MKARLPYPRPHGRSPYLEDAPSVLSVIEAMEERRRALASRLRDFALSLGDVEERTLFDSFCNEWTPAYYAGRRQLFHVHDFRSGLRGTMFFGMSTLQPFIMQSEEVSPRIRLLISNTPAPRGTGMLRVPLESDEDVDEFMDLVRLKWEFLRTQTKRPRAKQPRGTSGPARDGSPTVGA